MIYTTKDIIDIIVKNTKQHKIFLLEKINFDEWEKRYRGSEDFYKELFTENIYKNFPLHSDVLKLIYKELFSEMPFSKAYILKQYEQTLDEIDYLLFPAIKADRLVILFSGLSGHKTYNRFSWYWDVGTDKNPLREKYIKIIQSVLNKYSIDRGKTITVGGSMGGYASLLFAFDMGLRGAISVHPQITYKSTRKHHINDWESKIRECGSQFYDLTDFIFKRHTIPFVYLEYGDYEADKEGAEELIQGLQKREALVVFRKTLSKDHVTNNPSKVTVDSIITLFENTGFDDEYIK